MMLGVDLGLTGAVACLNDDGSPRWVSDMPVMMVAVGKRQRGAYDAYHFRRLLLPLTANESGVTVICEDVYHLGFRGSLAARAAGIGWGLVVATCEWNQWPLIAVAPKIWKEVMLAGRAKGKGAARARAAELFPGVDLGKAKDEGRAEALLLASYGWRLRSGG